MQNDMIFYRMVILEGFPFLGAMFRLGGDGGDVGDGVFLSFNFISLRMAAFFLVGEVRIRRFAVRFGLVGLLSLKNL